MPLRQGRESECLKFDNVPMNLKDEIVAGESYSLEFKRVPNEEREKYLKTVVAFAS